MFVARSVMLPQPTGTPVGAGARRYRAHWAFTDAVGDAADAGSARAGEPGVEHFGNFNLGGHVGDEAARVRGFRRRLVSELGGFVDGIVWMNQVHGKDVALVERPWPEGEAADVDGVVTTRPGLGVGVLVADCVPVVLADPTAGVVAAAHAGRKGMISGVVSATVSRMREVGATDIRAAIGPSICGSCYEVPGQMREEAGAVRPESASTTSWGTAAIDVAAGVEAELRQLRVRSERVAGCTLTDDSLYSYRRHRRTGRFCGVVVLEEVS